MSQFVSAMWALARACYKVCTCFYIILTLVSATASPPIHRRYNHTLSPQIPGYKGPSPVKTEEHGLGGSRPKALSGATWQGKA